LNQTNIISVPR